MLRFRSAGRVGVLAAAVAAAACDSPGGPRPQVAARIDIVSGNEQEAAAGTALPNPLVVKVADGRGRPVRGQTVTFSVSSGGGGLAAATALTDQDGEARGQWTLGTSTAAADSQRVEARVADAAGATLASTTFRATARAAAAAVVARVSGDQQSGTVGAALPDPLRVIVRDQFGNPVGGAAVAWTASAGGQLAASGVTGADGTASATWTLGSTAGGQAASASVGGAQTAFTAAALAGPPAQITIDPPATPLRFGVTVQLTATARDAFGNVVPATFTWASETPQLAAPVSGASFRGTGVGTARVSASAGGVTGRLDVPVMPLRFSAVAVGRAHTCAPTADGLLFCWGLNSSGQLGTAGDNRNAPALVEALRNVRVVAVSLGSDHSCAISADGVAYCWGSDGNGQLGDGAGTGSRTAPAPVAGDVRFASLALGSFHGCGRTSAGVAYCWGMNSSGQLGSVSDASCGTGRNPECNPAPKAVDTAVRFASLTAGQFHSCGLDAAGKAYCWGSNASGQLGAPSSETCIASLSTGVPCSRAPLPVTGGLTFASLDAYLQSTCGVAANGTLYCWGADYGPAPVAASAPPSRSHSCSVAADDKGYCRGNNESGQLGNGTFTASPTPVPAAGQ